MFSHKAASTSSIFYTIHTAGNNSISATASHYLWVAKGGAPPQVVAAASVVVGDQLLVAAKGCSHLERVTTIRRSVQQGLFNVHTQSGSIVIDSIAALTFTTSIPACVTLHSVLMAPVRLLHAILPDSVLAAINDNLLPVYFAGADWMACFSKWASIDKVFGSIIT